MHQIIALITARGGSKSIPQKNIKMLAGKPLIAWTIEAAFHAQRLSRVIVSTDDDEIANVARHWGAEVPFTRPAELAQDHSDHISVVEHAIHWLAQHGQEEPEYVMLLQPTSPLRTSEDIDAAICIAEERSAVAVVSVCETKHHPYAFKRILKSGTLADILSSDIPYQRRQALPSSYAINGAIYLNRRESLLRLRTFFPPDAQAYVMPPERSLDIDTSWDLYRADLILQDASRNDNT